MEIGPEGDTGDGGRTRTWPMPRTRDASSPLGVPAIQPRGNGIVPTARPSGYPPGENVAAPDGDRSLSRRLASNPVLERPRRGEESALDQSWFCARPRLTGPPDREGLGAPTMCAS